MNATPTKSDDDRLVSAPAHSPVDKGMNVGSYNFDASDHVGEVFEVGRTIGWLHGEHYRVAEILEVEQSRVKLSGVSGREYWRSKKSLLQAIDRVPVNCRQTW